jgi:hypothetical protein
MLENAQNGSCQQVGVKLEIEEEIYAERSERGRRKGGQIETDSRLKTSPSVLRFERGRGREWWFQGSVNGSQKNN